MSLQIAFLDIGGTLGTVSTNPLKLSLYASSIPLLSSLRDALGIKVGIITNIPSSMTKQEVNGMLKEAGIHKFFDPALIVTSNDGFGSKPEKRIYQHAIEVAQVDPSHCIFIGESEQEVSGATSTGMLGLVKPAV